jgi:hypothetical protein
MSPRYFPLPLRGRTLLPVLALVSLLAWTGPAPPPLVAQAPAAAQDADRLAQHVATVEGISEYRLPN